VNVCPLLAVLQSLSVNSLPIDLFLQEESVSVNLLLVVRVIVGGEGGVKVGGGWWGNQTNLYWFARSVWRPAVSHLVSASRRTAVPSLLHLQTVQHNNSKTDALYEDKLYFCSTAHVPSIMKERKKKERVRSVVER